MIVPSSAQSEPILYLLSHLSPKGQAGSALLLITLISAAQRRRRWESLPSMLKWRLVYIFFRFAANRFSVCVCSVCWLGDFSASLRKQLLGNKITELCKQTNETLEGSKSNLGLFTWKKALSAKKVFIWKLLIGWERRSESFTHISPDDCSCYAVKSFFC